MSLGKYVITFTRDGYPFRLEFNAKSKKQAVGWAVGMIEPTLKPGERLPRFKIVREHILE